MVSWNTMNFLMELKMVRPYRIALSMELKLSSRITISLASFATSVPPPIAKPTSAFLSAGESFTPSPVIPATRSSSWARRTRRLLSLGSALAITRIFGSIFLISSSDSLASSSEVSTTSLSFSSRPASLAIATAVSLRSPVIMTTCTPAPFTSAIAVTDSGRTSSRIPTTPTRVQLLLSGRASSPRESSLVAIASTRIARFASSSICLLSSVMLNGCFSPFSSQ